MSPTKRRVLNIEMSNAFFPQQQTKQQAGTDLQTHVVGEAREEVVLHVTVDERVSEDEVEDRVARQVQHPGRHLVDPHRTMLRRVHGQTNVLKRSRSETNKKITHDANKMTTGVVPFAKSEVHIHVSNQANAAKTRTNVLRFRRIHCCEVRAFAAYRDDCTTEHH